MNQASADIAIFGGGIAGLWLLHRLREAGFAAILFESNTLGGGQTCRSQGIIHGGMKYALQGVMTNDAKAMAEMPAVWLRCLQGKGEIDFTSVRILSTKQYLWAPNKLIAKVGGFLAGAALSSKVQALEKADYPDVFKQPAFKGEVYALDEYVVDVPGVIQALFTLHHDAIFKIDGLTANDFHYDAQRKLESVTLHAANQTVALHAQQFIFTAGAGNEVALNTLKQTALGMQRRPLHMVLVKTPFQYPLYAHCLGMGARPRMTITTHFTSDGGAVWYLGGLIAETGVERDSHAQIKAARDELCSLFPWLDFSNAAFSTFMIDRAEPLQKNGMKPETSFHQRFSNVMIAWPTKLALAPKLAADILHDLQAATLQTHASQLDALQTFPKPELATPVWEEAFCKHVA
jgi:glycerol-3-phosphate dehydrogenase